MTKKIKLGIIGFGRIVELVHLPLLKQLQEIEVAGIFDITPKRLSLAAKRGFAGYSKLEDLLELPIDAVLIATPPNSHYPIAEQALRYGKHVLIEKPVTLTAAEAIKLKQVAEIEEKLVTVFHNRRFDSDYLFVKKMIDEGQLGSILFVERRHHMFGSGASFGVKSFYQQWRNETGYGGGALLDWGIHLIDQFLQLGLGRCVEIRSSMRSFWSDQGDVDDYVHAVMSTDRNVLLSMDINFGSAAASPLWVVGGDQASLQVMSTSEAYLYQPGKQPVLLELKPSDNSEPLRIYTSFMDALLHGGKLEVTLDEAIETMDILDKIRASAQMNKELEDGNLIHSATV